MFGKGSFLFGALVLGLAITTTPPVFAEPARDVAQLTNRYRAQHGLPPLRVSGMLEQIAERHGRDMGRHRFFSHTGSDGSDIGDRALRGGYRYCVIAENLAMGHRTPKGVLRGWINSHGHRENLLDRDVTEIGVTRGHGNLWVMVLGRNGC